MKIGVIVGRFQTPILHAGHLYLIGTAIQECDLVYIFLGESTERNERNPYSALKRKDIIHKVFPTIIVRGISDKPSDKEWNVNLDKSLDLIYEQNFFGDPEINLYHSRDSFAEVYKGKYSCKALPELPGFSATAIRMKNNLSSTVDPKFTIPEDINLILQNKKAEKIKEEVLKKEQEEVKKKFHKFEKECIEYKICPKCGNQLTTIEENYNYALHKCKNNHNFKEEFDNFDPDDGPA